MLDCFNASLLACSHAYMLNCFCQSIREAIMLMKAAVCYEFGKPLVVEEIEIAPPQAGEVRVRMVATAICHSDIHLIRGEWGGEPPIVAGHEGAGIVEAIGPGVQLVQPGDHVVVSLLRSCGRCRFCSTGTPHLCEGRFALAHESRLRNKAGQTIKHGIDTAAFAEYVIVDQSQLVGVPPDMPLDQACLLACGVITGIGAVVNRARVHPGSSVVVIGAGGVGLNALQGARLAGAHPIIAIDLVEQKLQTARDFGATHTIHGANESALERVAELTGGRMADYVFVTVGSTRAAEQAYDLAGTRGTVVYVGIPDWVSQVPVTMGETITSEKTITGSLMGSARLQVDVPWLVGLYQAERLKLRELITAHYPLSQINQAIESTESGAALRNVILFA
jgi:S-(hydroxymethyl)glutathione dehydrogenase / alcohol dehydrogenase